MLKRKDEIEIKKLPKEDFEEKTCGSLDWIMHPFNPETTKQIKSASRAVTLGLVILLIIVGMMMI